MSNDPNDPYDLVKHDGKTVDRITHEALKEAERRLGYELTITQGSYTGGVDASAGTHDGGGVVDLAAFEAARKVRVLRNVGFAAWRRMPSEGPWPEHVHAVLIGNKKLSPAARRQVEAYLANPPRNGLKSNLIDRVDRPDPIPLFRWPQPETRMVRIDALIQQARELGWEALQDHDPGPRRDQINDGLAKLREAQAAFPDQ